MLSEEKNSKSSFFIPQIPIWNKVLCQTHSLFSRNSKLNRKSKQKFIPQANTGHCHQKEIPVSPIHSVTKQPAYLFKD